MFFSLSSIIKQSHIRLQNSCITLFFNLCLFISYIHSCLHPKRKYWLQQSETKGTWVYSLFKKAINQWVRYYIRIIWQTPRAGYNNYRLEKWQSLLVLMYWEWFQGGIVRKVSLDIKISKSELSKIRICMIAIVSTITILDLIIYISQLWRHH